MNTNIKTGKNKIILINKGVLSLFISLFVFSYIFSQERLPKIKKDSTGYVHVTGMVEKNNKPMENASIIVYKNNKKINHLRTPPNGKFVLKFDFNLQYKVEILKQGMVTKRFEFDTKLPVGYSDKAVFPFQFTIVLFPNYKYIDMSILEKPLAIIRFDKSYEDFFYDYNYAKTINDKVMYIQGRIEQLTKEYAKCVEEGRAFFDKKEYLLALNKFVRANEIFPDEPYPIERIALIKKLLGEKKNKRAIYEALVAEADEKVKQTEYESAITYYEQALDILPSELYPQQRIRDLKKILANMTNKESNYNQLITKGDQLFDMKKYAEARRSYADASNLFPERPYPKDRIAEIDRITGRSTELLEKYNLFVAQADKLFNERKFKDALNPYKEANKILPEEKYPKDKIAQINKILYGQNEKDEAYRKVVTVADKLFDVKDYQNARIYYQKALEIKPDENHPKERINQINAILGDIASQSEAYKKLVAEGDRLFKIKKYKEARNEYQNAYKMRPDEQYPKAQMDEIDKILANMADIQKQYDAFIKDADRFFANQDLLNARDKYQAASDLKPDEKYPLDKINQINNLLNDREAKMKNYNELIAKADKLFDSKQFTSAKENYLKALDIFPDENHPKNRIAEIDKIFALDENYKTIIKQADTFLEQKNYNNAIEKYKSALLIKPDEEYPKKQIDKINKLLADFQNADEAYKKAITEGDRLLKVKEFSAALDQFKNALLIKPSEQYPKDKIAEINKILTEKNALRLAYDKKIAEADKFFVAKDYIKAKETYIAALDMRPDEAYPKKKIAEIDDIFKILANKEKEYDEIIKNADKLFNEKQYDNALNSYQQALKLKPQEKYPKDKIDEINKIFGERKSLQLAYDRKIVEADKLLKDKEYQKAKDAYTEALTIKPGEEYPQKKITEIDNIFKDLAAKEQEYKDLIIKADNLFNQKNYEDALSTYQQALQMKPLEKYPKDQIAEINKIFGEKKTLLLNYERKIAEADKLLKDKDYQKAKDAYNEALTIKPGEEYPQKKIFEIENIFKDLAAKEQKYKDIIIKADNLFNQKNYEDALSAYQQALQMKPLEKYPKDQIAEINKIFGEKKTLQLNYERKIAEADKLFKDKEYQKAKDAYQAASNLKPDERYPKTKIDEINSIFAALALKDKEYNDLINNGDKLLSQKKYNDAIDSYQKALAVKPNEKYPKDKITEINKLLDEQKLSDEKYQKIIIEADDAFEQKTYDKAKETYNKALLIKPNEDYPKTKIAEINKILNDIQAENKIYFNLINEADNYFIAKDYSKAKSLYQQASDFRPQEKYPKDRLAEIEKLLAEVQVKMDNYIKIIKDADLLFDSKDYNKARGLYLQATVLQPNEQHPKSRIEEINAILAAKQLIEENYQKFIINGDKALTNKEYDVAKEAYEKALEVKPDEKYPKEKLAEIEKEIKKFMVNQQQYTKTIVEADNLFNQQQYRDARESYKKAKELNPTQKHPRQRIAEINDILRAEEYEKAIGDINKELIKKQTTKKYSFTPITDKKGNNFILIKAKNLSKSKFNVILSYGKDEDKSGGFVVTTLDNDEVNDYIIRVNTQESWFKIDNNWISLEPLGGDIEVYSIQIVQGK